MEKLSQINLFILCFIIKYLDPFKINTLLLWKMNFDPQATLTLDVIITVISKNIFYNQNNNLLTCAIPPTNLVFTTTLSSSALSKAAFWAALTKLSEAFFTAFPAI